LGLAVGVRKTQSWLRPDITPATRSDSCNLLAQSMAAWLAGWLLCHDVCAVTLPSRACAPAPTTTTRRPLT
jgi:hypothetical protein